VVALRHFPRVGLAQGPWGGQGHHVRGVRVCSVEVYGFH
jgi:hypothetical protein